MSRFATNRHAIRAGYTPCEMNPETGKLSRLGDPFHHVAEVTVGSARWNHNRLRVCHSCSNTHAPGWPKVGGPQF